MRKQIVICDICGKEEECQAWKNLDKTLDICTNCIRKIIKETDLSKFIAAGKKKHECPECGAMTDGHRRHQNSSGGWCDMVFANGGGWRQLGVYDG